MKHLDYHSLKIIEKAIKEGVNPALLLNRKYDLNQIEEIRLTSKVVDSNKIDLFKLFNPVLNHKQMEQIRLGIIDDVDIDLFRNPIYDENVMLIKRMSLNLQVKENHLESKLREILNNNKLDLIDLCRIYDVYKYNPDIDLTKYYIRDMNIEILLEFLKAEIEGIKLNSFLNIEFESTKTLKFIKEKVSQGIDISSWIEDYMLDTTVEKLFFLKELNLTPSNELFNKDIHYGVACDYKVNKVLIYDILENLPKEILNNKEFSKAIEKKTKFLLSNSEDVLRYLLLVVKAYLEGINLNDYYDCDNFIELSFVLDAINLNVDPKLFFKKIYDYELINEIIENKSLNLSIEGTKEDLVKRRIEKILK